MAHTWAQNQAQGTWTMTVVHNGRTIQLVLKPNNGLPEHTEIVNALNHVSTGEEKRDRLEELLRWNDNYAYVIFCAENQIIIAPGVTVTPDPEPDPAP